MVEKNKNIDYPLNLVCKVYGLSHDQFLNLSPYVLVDENVDKALTTLDEREQTVLVSRYKEHLEHVMIGRQLGITILRVRQIEQKALRKLRHPSRRAIMAFKSIDVLEDRIKLLERINTRLKNKLYIYQKPDNESLTPENSLLSEDEIKLLITNGITTFGDLKAIAHHGIATPIVKLSSKDVILNLMQSKINHDINLIDVLDVPLYVIYMLKRSGIHTISDFQRKIKSFEDLTGIENLGRKSACNIIKELDRLGYDVSNLACNQPRLESELLEDPFDDVLTLKEEVKRLQAENELLKQKLSHWSELLSEIVEYKK